MQPLFVLHVQRNDAEPGGVREHRAEQPVKSISGNNFASQASPGALSGQNVASAWTKNLRNPL